MSARDETNTVESDEEREGEQAEFVEADEQDETLDVGKDGEPTGDEEDDGEDDGEEDGAEGPRPKQRVAPAADDSILKFTTHTDSVYSVHISPVAPLAVSGGGDDKAYLWNVADGSIVRELTGHTDSVIVVQFSADGQYVATGGLDGTIRVWETAAAAGEPVQVLDGPDEVQWLQWHPKGAVLLVGATDGTVWMWTLPQGQVMQVFSGHNAPVTCGRFSPDGKVIVTGSEDCSAIVWNPKTGAATHKFTGDLFHEGPLNDVAINADSTLVVSGSMDGTAVLGNIKNGKIVGTLRGHEDSIETVGWCHTLPFVATGSMDGKVNVWDTTNLSLRHSIMHEDGIVRLLWHGAVTLISCSLDRTVRVMDGRSGVVAGMLRGHEDTVLDASVNKDGTLLVSGSDDGQALVFRVPAL